MYIEVRVISVCHGYFFFFFPWDIKCSDCQMKVIIMMYTFIAFIWYDGQNPIGTVPRNLLTMIIIFWTDYVLSMSEDTAFWRIMCEDQHEREGCHDDSCMGIVGAVIWQCWLLMDHFEGGGCMFMYSQPQGPASKCLYVGSVSKLVEYFEISCLHCLHSLSCALFLFTVYTKIINNIAAS